VYTYFHRFFGYSFALLTLLVLFGSKGAPHVVCLGFWFWFFLLLLDLLKELKLTLPITKCKQTHFDGFFDYSFALLTLLVFFSNEGAPRIVCLGFWFLLLFFDLFDELNYSSCS